MGYKVNIRDAYSWNNLLRDSHVELTDTNNHFASVELEGALDELYDLASAAGGVVWNSVIMDTTAVANNGYFVNTSGGLVTITLPLSASMGDKVIISDISATFATYNCVIGRNSHKIMGLSEDFTCDINNLCIEMIYSNATNGWKITNFTI